VKLAREEVDDEDEDCEGLVSSANGGATVPAKPNTTVNTTSKATTIRYRLLTLKAASLQIMMQAMNLKRLMENHVQR
jgi:hypothetical protein